jgi:hypothetical protein
MGNPFLFADRFSGAVVHLTTDYRDGGSSALVFFSTTTNSKNKKCPRQSELTQAFPD